MVRSQHHCSNTMLNYSKNWEFNYLINILSSWSFRYAPVLIATYNVWDLISRYIPLVESLKMESRKGLMIAILARFLVIPAFYFTAKYGDKGWMILLTSLLGVSNGYLTVCVITVAPKGYRVSWHTLLHTVCSKYGFSSDSSRISVGFIAL